jgi:hypothetical protein
MKFQVFQSLDALKDAAQFLFSFQVTGTDDAATKHEVFARFNALVAKAIRETYGLTL